MMALGGARLRGLTPQTPGRARGPHDTYAAGGLVASSWSARTVSSAVCSRGILPVGCPCVLRRSRGKAMEMSH